MEDLLKKTSDFNIEDITTYDIIVVNCENNNEYKELISNGLSLFFMERVEYINQVGVFRLGNKDNARFIDRNNYELIKKILRVQNCLISNQTVEEFNPANDKARELMEKIKRNREELSNIKPKKQEEITLYSIISGTAWKSHIGINSVWDFTIYQLYDAYARLDLIDIRDKTLSGIYAGTIDSKEINLKDLSWTKNYKINN